MKNKTKIKTRKRERGYTYFENVKSQLYFENIGNARESRSLDFTTSHHINIVTFLLHIHGRNFLSLNFTSLCRIVLPRTI